VYCAVPSPLRAPALLPAATARAAAGGGRFVELGLIWPPQRANAAEPSRLSELASDAFVVISALRTAAFSMIASNGYGNPGPSLVSAVLCCGVSLERRSRLLVLLAPGITALGLALTYYDDSNDALLASGLGATVTAYLQRLLTFTPLGLALLPSRFAASDADARAADEQSMGELCRARVCTPAKALSSEVNEFALSAWAVAGLLWSLDRHEGGAERLWIAALVVEGVIEGLSGLRTSSKGRLAWAAALGASGIAAGVATADPDDVSFAVFVVLGSLALLHLIIYILRRLNFFRDLFGLGPEQEREQPAAAAAAAAAAK
jgi:hypothetical protein